VKGIQKAMLQSMTQSLTIPHFGYCDEIEMTKAMEFRRQLNNSPETKVTMMPILLKAASLALKSYPVLNSSLSECQTQLVQHASHNMGFAMDTPRGLLVRGVRA
jgi:2-oxoisovalerate dehydrogenase E2 component (dihydrolipoyl transacylase)